MLADKDLQSIQEVRTKVAAAHEAFLQFRPFTQEQVDRIIDHAAAAARAHAESLAKLAVEETGYGVGETGFGEEVDAVGGLGVEAA